MKGEYDSVSKGDMSLEYIEHKGLNNSNLNNNSMMMDIEKPHKEMHSQLDSILNRKGSFNIPSGGNNSYDNKDRIDY